MYRLPLLIASALISADGHALGLEATLGKDLYPACHVCHNPALDPPLGPPMWGVKRRYEMGTLDDEDFIESMVTFVKAPSMDNAKHDEAVRRLGLMPALPLPDEMLTKIARYILEETFAPPCDHWRIAEERAGSRGDPEHALKDGKMLDRFCR